MKTSRSSLASVLGSIFVVAAGATSAVSQPGVRQLPRQSSNESVECMSPDGRFLVGRDAGDEFSGVRIYLADMAGSTLVFTRIPWGPDQSLSCTSFPLPPVRVWAVAGAGPQSELLVRSTPWCSACNGYCESLIAINPLVNNTSAGYSILPPAQVTDWDRILVSGSGTLIAAQARGPSASGDEFTSAGRIDQALGSLIFTPMPGLSTLLGVGRTNSGAGVIIGSSGQVVRRVDALSGTGSALVSLPAGFLPQFASGDGSTVVGITAAGPARWRAATGVQQLDTAGYVGVVLAGLSENGSTIIANGRRASYNPPFPWWTSNIIVWRDSTQGEDLWSILPEPEAGTMADGWTHVAGVSADGSMVTGQCRARIDTSSQPDIVFLATLPPRRGESCADPIPATYGATFASTKGATRNASPAFGCSLSEGSAPDLFFSFVPLANETVTIDTCGSDFDTTLVVTTLPGGCGSAGTLVACNDDGAPACPVNAYASSVQCSVFAGQSYWIRVSGYNGARGGVQLNITAPDRPANDLCTGAINVDPGFSRNFSTINAITGTSPPTCHFFPTLFGDVWFSTVATDTGAMTFSTCGSSFSTGLAVYDGSPCANPSQFPIACSTGGCPSGGATATVPCAPGQMFFVRVGGLFGSSGSGGVFSAVFSCDPPRFDGYRAAVMADNPVGFWRLDDSGNTAADQVRNNAASSSCGDHPGWYEPAAGRTSLGLSGGAIDLARGGTAVDHIFAPAPSLANPCGDYGAWTTEAWVKTTSPTAGVVMTQRYGPNDHSLTLAVGSLSIGPQPGKAIFFADGPGVLTGAVSTSNVADGHWHHIVGTRQFDLFAGGWFYRVYVDGALEGVNNLPGVGSPVPAEPNGANSWIIGSSPAWDPSGAAFLGQIDEVALYCSTMPGQRIAAHYHAGWFPCNPGDIAGIGGNPPPDGLLTGDDFNAFISAFAAGDLLADVVSIGGLPPPDGLITGDDFNAFIAAFAAGCP